MYLKYNVAVVCGLLAGLLMADPLDGVEQAAKPGPSSAAVAVICQVALPGPSASLPVNNTAKIYSNWPGGASPVCTEEERLAEHRLPSLMSSPVRVPSSR